MSVTMKDRPSLFCRSRNAEKVKKQSAGRHSLRDFQPCGLLYGRDDLEALLLPHEEIKESWMTMDSDRGRNLHIVLPRKEVIQPQVPLRLPCYDLTPITAYALAGCIPLLG